MIPDKIYIRHYWMPGELDDEWRLKPVEDEKCEEYIRKEAILEWAKEQKKATEELIKEHPKDDSLWAEMHWYEQLIKHIESL